MATSRQTTLEWVSARVQMAIGFGLVAGLLLSAACATIRHLLGKLVHAGPDTLIVAPVAYVTVFALVSLMLLSAGRLWAPLGRLHVQAGVLAFLGTHSILMMSGRLHWLAILALSLGVGARASSTFDAHSASALGAVRRIIVPLACLLLIWWTGVEAMRWRTRSQAVAELPAMAAGTPNVILVVLDTVRAQSLSLYGYGLETSPALEQLARRGVVWNNALSTAPWTLPAHGSLMTGRWAHELSVSMSTPLDATFPTLAETLSAQGYLTVGVVANRYFCSSVSGLNRGFIDYFDYERSGWQALLQLPHLSQLIDLPLVKRLAAHAGIRHELGRKKAAEVNASFLSWIDQVGSRPFFAFLNYIDAHAPYAPDPPFDRRFGATEVLPPLDHARGMTDAEAQAQRTAYLAAIASLDYRVGELMHALDARGVLDHSVVIITSDHGEEFSEHGTIEHGGSLFRPALQVPLLMLGPKVPRAMRIDTPVTIRDLPATIVDLLNPSIKNPFPGQSLARFWSGGHRDSEQAGAEEPILAYTEQQDFPAHYPAAVGPVRSTLVSGFQYILKANGEETLFDFWRDPWERRDLSGEPHHRGDLELLQMTTRSAWTPVRGETKR